MKPPAYFSMEHCDIITLQNATMPYIKSVYSCLNGIIGNGYTDVFLPMLSGLHSHDNNCIYEPSDVTVINRLRFEGSENPEDNIVLYIIETADGSKGTLTQLCKADTGQLF